MADQNMKALRLQSRMLGIEDFLFKKERLAIFTLIFLPKYILFCLGLFIFSNALHLFDFNLRLQHGLKSPEKYDHIFMVERGGMILLALHHILGANVWYLAVGILVWSNMFYLVKQKNLFQKFFEPASMTSSLNPKIDPKKGKKSTNKEAKENKQTRNCAERRIIRDLNSVSWALYFVSILETYLFWYERFAMVVLMFTNFNFQIDIFYTVDVLFSLLCFLIIQNTKPGPTDPSYIFWIERAGMIFLASYKIDGTISSLYSAAILFAFTNTVYLIKPLRNMLETTTHSRNLKKKEEEAKLLLRRLTTENEELKEKLIDEEERWAEKLKQDKALSKHFEQRLLEAEKESQALEKDKKKLVAEIEELTAKVEEKWIETLKRDRTDEARVDTLEKELSEARNASQALEEDKRRLRAEIEELKAKLNDATEEAEQTDADLDAYQQLICNLDIEKRELVEKLNQYQQGDNSASQLVEKLRQNGEELLAEIKNLKDEVNRLTSVSEHDQSALFSLEKHSLNWLEEREKFIGVLAEWDENRRIWKEEKENLENEKENLLAEKEDLLVKINELDEQQEMLEVKLMASKSWYMSYFSKAIELTEASIKWTTERKLLESDLFHGRKEIEYYKTLLLDYQEKCFKLNEEAKGLAEDVKLKTGYAEVCEELADEYNEKSRKLQNDNDGLEAQLADAMDRCELYRSLLRDQDSCPTFA